MKRIINLVTHMEAGGAQGAAIRMSKEMRERGIDAETWFIYQKADTYTDEEKVHIIHDKPPTNIKDVFRIIKKIKQRIKQNPPHGVISYTHYASTLGHIASNRVATMRNPVWTYPRFAKMLNKWMGANSYYTKIIAVSNTVKKSCDSYSKKYRDNIIVVYNGVPARISSMDKASARQKFGFGEIGDNKLLVHVGRLHPQKNQQLLIRIVAEIKGYHLVIAGDGELREDLNNLARELNVQDRVHMLGEIKPYDVPDFLRCGDMFLFPSVFEAFGFVIFEAAYNGLPVVASNIPSNVEVLSDNKNETAGIIVKTMNVPDWIKAIKQLEDEEIRKQYDERMQVKLIEFDFNKMVDSYIKYATENI